MSLARGSAISSVFRQKKGSAFLAQLKGKDAPVNSALSVQNLSTHFEQTMMDDPDDLLPEQNDIVQAVTKRHDFLREQLLSVPLDRTALKNVLSRLRTNSAPGPDGITAEHPMHAQCDSLLEALHGRSLQYCPLSDHRTN
jgi:hypothetical protein